MKAFRSLRLVDAYRVVLGPDSIEDDLFDYARTHLWETGRDGSWRSPLTVQFEQPLPERLYRCVGRLVARWPDVEVYAYGQADSSLRWLRHMPQLEHLSLNSYRMDTFDALQDVPSLRSLSLPETLGPTPSLAVLARLTEIEELGLGGRGRDFEAVSSLRRLRVLSLYASRMPNLEPLADSTRLEILKLSFGKIHDFTPLTGLPGLRGIGIWQTRGMTTSDLAAFADLPVLEALDLGAMRGVDSLAPLRERPASTLRYLLLEGMAGLVDFSDIAELRALEELGVWGKGPLNPETAPLLVAPSLQALLVEPRLPEEQAAKLVKGFRGRDLLVNGKFERESPSRSRVGWRSGPPHMLRASVHAHQWIG